MTQMQQIIQSIRDGEIFKAPQHLGAIKMAGPDAESFLQRMSTADMNQLNISSALTTCFVNHYGRLIDRVMVIKLQEQEFLLISTFASAKTLYDWLEHYHFIENFSLSIEPDASLLLSSISSHRPVLWRSSQSECPVFFTLDVQSSERETLTHDQWETLRIASLMPWYQEICDRFMPQNVGLLSDISPNKGCFIGQEVIAKALTYQKHPTILQGLRLSQNEWQETQTNQQSAAGKITSLSPCFIEGFINVLVLRSEHKDALS